MQDAGEETAIAKMPLKRGVVWFWLNRIATVTGIVGFALSIYALRGVERLDDLVAAAESKWSALTLRLALPVADSEVAGAVADIKGTIEFDPTVKRRVPVRLQLVANQVEVLAMVRPHAEPFRWYVQPPLDISDSGSFAGTVRLGRATFPDTGPYDIVVIAVSRNTVSPTETFAALPFAFSQSELTRVVRTK